MDSEHNKIITIGAPLEGEWKYLSPPGHHPYAFDFVKTDNDNKKTHGKSLLHFIFNKIPSNEYYCWKEPVLSPVNGDVISIGDNWHDHKYTNLWNTIKIWYYATYKFRPKKESGVLDIRPNAGNHVMIKTDSGHIVFLAHLKNKSISVKQGQRVSEGEQIGLVGNSGNSTAPHLHINIFNQMEDPFTSKVLPFVFSDYHMPGSPGEWVNCRDSVPKVGTLIKFMRITNHSKWDA